MLLRSIFLLILMNPLLKKSFPNIYEVNEINMEIKIENYFSIHMFICSTYVQKSHSEVENLKPNLCKSELLRLCKPTLPHLTHVV